MRTTTTVQAKNIPRYKQKLFAPGYIFVCTEAPRRYIFSFYRRGAGPGTCFVCNGVHFLLVSRQGSNVVALLA